jgi:hypothetical protein
MRPVREASAAGPVVGGAAETRYVDAGAGSPNILRNDSWAPGQIARTSAADPIIASKTPRTRQRAL